MSLTKQEFLNRLPGSKPHQKRIERIIRVDHAGEFGAKRIYQGQLAILKNSPQAPIIKHMAEQEDHHLATFDRLADERDVPRTKLLPLWNLLGFGLGAGTALMGERAAMACTVAVEEVIDEHYQHQLNELDESEAELKSHIEQFRQEELEHRDIGLEHEAELTPAYHALTFAIKAGVKGAIWLSKRI